MRKEKIYTVTVLRIGYAQIDMRVSATSKKQARMQAENTAGDYEFSEHSSLYFAKETIQESKPNA